MGDLRRLVHSQWKKILAATLATLVLGIAWATSSPLGSSPDDDFHLASIWCGTFSDPGLCSPLETRSNDPDVRPVQVPKVIADGMYCYINNPQVSAACIDSFGDDAVGRGRANNGLYPSGFYSFMSIFASDQVNASMLLMRVLSFLVCLGLIAASALLAPRAVRTSFLTAVSIVSVPMGLSLYASNNPSGVVIAGVSAFWCALHSVFAAPTRARVVGSAVVAGLCALITMSSRVDSVVFLGAATVSVLLFRIPELTKRWAALNEPRRRIAIGAGLVLIAGAILFATQRAGGIPKVGKGSGYTLVDLLWPNLIDLPLMWSGAFGNGWALGWDVPMPYAVPFIMMIVLGGVIFQGVRKTSTFKSLSVAFGVLSAVGVPMVMLINSKVLITDRLVQPRYVMPVLVFVVASMLLPADRNRESTFVPSSPVAVLVLLSIANSLSLHGTLRRYVTGTNRIGLDLNDGIEWWWGTPINPLLMWLLGSVAFIVLASVSLSWMMKMMDVDKSVIDVGECVPNRSGVPSEYRSDGISVCTHGSRPRS